MNIFASIPIPVGNGSGAAVDMSGFGFAKTVSVAGSFVASVTIEISNELAPTRWAPLCTFNNPDGISVEAACRWMRATVIGHKSGVPTCHVGGDDGGATFANLPATPGDGAGAAVDVSALPISKTVTVGGPFKGNVQLEVSEDGVSNWSQVGFGFSAPGQQSQRVTASYMRVVRAGVPQIAPGLPVVNVGACYGDSAAPPASIQDLIIAPSQPEPFGPGANMPAGYIANWTQLGIADHTNLEWRGADNQATALTGIDATDIPEGAIRIFNNATLSPNDSGSVVLLDESDPHVTAGPYMSLPANRICTPLRLPYKVDMQAPVILQRRKNSNGDLRWFILSSSTRQAWFSAQGFGLYPHLQVGTPGTPIAGTVNNWSPTGVAYLGNADGLTIDGGDAMNARQFTFWNVNVDAAGLTVTGLLGSNGPATDYGTVKFIFNSGPGELRLAHNSGLSTPDNQLILPNARDYRVPALSGVWLVRPFADEGLGPVVQWRLMGVSNEVFPSVSTTGRTTTKALTLDPQENVVLAAGVNSDVDIGDGATVSFVGPANGAIVDGLIASQPLVGNEVRLLRNNGTGPIAFIDEIASASAVGNRFVLTNRRPLVVPPAGYATMQYVPLTGKWYALQQPLLARLPYAITPAALPGADVIDYDPVDAVTGWSGRYAGVWKISGAVGTQLCGVDPSPAGAEPYNDLDEILLINGGSGMIIVHASGLNVDAGSRIFCPNGANQDLRQYGCITLRRDEAGAVWFLDLNKE